jgi:hypothetical protein
MFGIRCIYFLKMFFFNTSKYFFRFFLYFLDNQSITNEKKTKKIVYFINVKRN